MLYAIIADIHSNLAAFEAVLDDIAGRGGVGELWCLGDVVGYGPDPHQCIELLRGHKHLCVAGNHDWAAIGKMDTSDFNREAAIACQWTGQQLSSEDVQYLQSLPLILSRENFTIVHGSPREPIWEYVLSTSNAEDNFACFETRFCLVGHSHVPLVFELMDENSVCLYRQFPDELLLGEHRLIINPGGVGQPRDGDPRASYAIYDSEAMAIYHCRVSYNIAATQERMIRQGLPWRLAARLDYGW